MLVVGFLTFVKDSPVLGCSGINGRKNFQKDLKNYSIKTLNESNIIPVDIEMVGSSTKNNYEIQILGTCE